LNQEKEYHKNNKEKISKKYKEYRENNKEYYKEYKLNYYKTNKEEINKKARKKYKENKEEIISKQKEYRKNNKEKLSEKGKLRNNRLCYDLIKKDFCAYGALKSRKFYNKEGYKDIKLSDCIIKPIISFEEFQKLDDLTKESLLNNFIKTLQ